MKRFFTKVNDYLHIFYFSCCSLFVLCPIWWGSRQTLLVSVSGATTYGISPKDKANLPVVGLLPKEFGTKLCQSYPQKGVGAIYFIQFSYATALGDHSDFNSVLHEYIIM